MINMFTTDGVVRLSSALSFSLTSISFYVHYFGLPIAYTRSGYSVSVASDSCSLTIAKDLGLFSLFRFTSASPSQQLTSCSFKFRARCISCTMLGEIVTVHLSKVFRALLAHHSLELSVGL